MSIAAPRSLTRHRVKKDIPPSAVTRPICGIMGTIRLVAGMYLIIITKKKKVGDLFGHNIWKATEFDIISYKKTVLHLTDNQMQDNKCFLAMLNNVLNTDGFYFATNYDLTHSLQRLSNTSPEFQEMSLLERADQRFVWNGHLLREFTAQPETRGSMPFFWSQRPNLKYKPKPQISKTINHMDGFQRHFDSQIISYGKQVVLNLINQKGSENPLEQAFAKMVKSLGNGMVKYVAFDFHKECSQMRWERLQILVDRVAEMQDEFGYFMVDSDGKVLMQQEGTFRSNCMDCLDRTNVIQSLLARRSLQSQLQDSIDLFLGNYAVDEADSSTPLHVQKDWKFLTLPIIMVVAFSMCIICLLMAGDTWTETLAYVLFWGTASIGTAAIILFNGNEFVDAPKLVQKEKMD
ncbi:UNVERIFIED_CONTAM: hypothetical protein FKN15_019456 [Acipenser sinensis]